MIISPPGTVYGDGVLSPSIPMGLLYLAGYLRDKKIDVCFYDALADRPERMLRVGTGRRYGAGEKRILAKIKKYKPEIVGIGTMFTAYFEDSLNLARLIKSFDRSILVVIGGSHVSIDPVESLLRSDCIDVAVYGEGEETFYEIARGVELKKIKGIVYRKRGIVVKNEPRSLINDLDSIPFPAWDMLDLKKYKMGSVFNMREPVFPIVSSRGCPGHCLYCSVNSVWQHRWRGRSPANVVDEMEMLMTNFGAREFAFQDDSLSVNKKRFEKLCDEIIARKLNIKWTTPNGIAHWTLNKKLIKKMKEAGCYRITFGIESADKKTRDWVGKPYDLNQAEELIRYANKIGMWTLSTNIIGFPYETGKQIKKTLDFAIESDVDLAFFFRLGPRPGTKIYDIFKENDWLMEDKHLLFSENVACRTKYFSGEDLVSLQKQMYRNFLIKRWTNPLVLVRIIRKIRSFEDFFYVVNMGTAGLKLGFNLLLSKSGVTSKTLRVKS
jgi:magnesium-protoporphyrin IX monomethyl ester (oxidative) cyclase